MILQPYFFSNMGMTVGSMNALWLAAPPMTSSFGWLPTMAGTPSVDTVAAAPTVLVRNCRRVTRSSVIASSSRSGFDARMPRPRHDVQGRRLPAQRAAASTARPTDSYTIPVRDDLSPRSDRLWPDPTRPEVAEPRAARAPDRHELRGGRRAVDPPRRRRVEVVPPRSGP